MGGDNPRPYIVTLDTELWGIVSDLKRRLKWWSRGGVYPRPNPLVGNHSPRPHPVPHVLWRTGYFPWADMFIIG